MLTLNHHDVEDKEYSTRLTVGHWSYFLLIWQMAKHCPSFHVACTVVHVIAPKSHYHALTQQLQGKNIFALESHQPAQNEAYFLSGLS